MKFLLPLFTLFLLASDSPEKAWSNQTELSLVASEGNTQSQSWGFANEFDYTFHNAELESRLRATHVDSTRYQRRAVGSAEDWQLVEDREKVTTARNFGANLKYNHQISSKVYWFTAGDWLSNEFAGIRARTSLSGGLGHKWKREKSYNFRTDYGLQYTHEQPLFEPEDFQGDFTSLRLGYKFFKKVTKTSGFKQELQAETNLKETSDFLAVLSNNFDVIINAHLALKVGGVFRFDSDPAYIQIKRYELADDSIVSGTVPFQKEMLDTTLTTSLVINF